MPNALHHECSPYLLQHADQPVDWQPWGEAAFDLARRENKLVFLSVGYSTCHWCHVMAHESFDDEAIAGILNHHFVSVKVDREERPDIDAAYMSFVQASTGQGGWPMSVWLTPDGEPVFGGTYFPPEDRHGRPGFPRVCHELARLWRDDRAHLDVQAKQIMEHLRRTRGTGIINDAGDDEAFAAFLKRCRQMFDLEWGGFGGAPKFPRPVVLRTLMQIGERMGLENPDGMDVKAMVEGTLLAMARGGIHDHLGGGFHRYSVDRYWHVPHYEKMLYDQGQLAMTYLEAWQMTGEASHRQVAEGIFDYLTGTMRDSGGAFHAAEDADSLPQHGAKHPREGAFWTWEAGEISQHLDPRTAAIFHAAYGVEADGNARPESDPHRELVGQNTLFRAKSDEELAMMFHVLPEEIRDTLKDAKAVLLAVREKRPKPHRDDKIVSAWNGLAIAAMARGGRVLGRDDLTAAATAAAGFIRRELWDESGLYRSFRGRRSEAHGFPIDYSCLIFGLIELHMASPDGGWLDWALALQDQFDRHCWDDPQSGYLMRPSLQGKLLMSIRDDYDGAEPSANHLAIENLLKLAELTGNEAYRARARTMLDAGRPLLAEQVFAAPVLLSALDLAQRGASVVHVPHDTPADLSKRLRESYWPRALFVPGESKELIVCENQSCRPLDRNAD